MFEKFIFWKCLKQLIAEIFTCKSKAAVDVTKSRLWSGSAMSQLAGYVTLDRAGASDLS